MEILKVSPKNFNQIIRKVEKVIKKGGVLICPTDTVYGLLGDATNQKAVARVLKIKKRAKEKSLPIFVKDIEMARKFAKLSKNQEKILKNNWPGKITFILKRKPRVKIYGIAQKTIGLRIPKYKLVSQLLKRLKGPLTGTSANISGKPASTKIKEILIQFEKAKIKPDLVLDAGNLKFSLPSTIVDLTGKIPSVLRKGAKKDLKVMYLYRKL